MVKLVDLSHPIAEGMPIYPGLPGPQIGAHLTHEESRSHYNDKAEFYISRYEYVGSLGSYLDSPFHRYPSGADLAGIPLKQVAHLPGLVVDARPTLERALSPRLLQGLRVRGKAILFRTDWSERWGTKSYWEPAPYLSSDLCRTLIRRGATLVGVDFWNVDDVNDLSRPAHSMLLAAGVLIVENLANLKALPATDFHLHVAPLAIEGGASAPLRAYAVVKNTKPEGNGAMAHKGG